MFEYDVVFTASPGGFGRDHILALLLHEGDVHFTDDHLGVPAGRALSEG